MRGSRAATVVLWVAFAFVAVASGWIAVRMVGNAITPASVPVLTADEVSRRLTTATPAPTIGGSAKPTPSRSGGQRPSDSATPAVKTVVRNLSSRGGSVVAACRDGVVTLRSWSPAVGYGVDEVDPGPSVETEVRFSSPNSEVRMRVTCVGGVPAAQTSTSGGATEPGEDE